MNVQTARTVRLDKLRIEATNWTNPREFTGLADDDISELGASIKAKGIVDPLKVQRILVNGEVADLVIDGQRRYLAAKEVLPKTAEIPVVDLSEEPIELTPEKADELLLKALTTLEREDLSDYELSSIAERMKVRGKTGKYIGAAVGHDESWVSKILKARSTATPKLMLRWRKGELTTEMFKELAEVKDPDEQEKATKEVVEARKSGDKSEARVLSKEIKETARAKSAPAKPEKAGGKPKAVVSGPQAEMFERPAPKPAGPKPPSKVVLEELLNMAKRRPPTADYVKGIMDGVRYATGSLDPSEFGKAWAQYVSRIEGRPKPAKKAKAAKTGTKAKAKRPAKKTRAKVRRR
jgi:ParB-like chromosome segregation protein Spo0J